MTSVLGPEDFAAKVLSVMPKDVKSGDLGCGRILAAQEQGRIAVADYGIGVVLVDCL